ncbi:MAG: hypothetical protein ACPKPY_11555 [Nitrososphaeraceae archaeon]
MELAENIESNVFFKIKYELKYLFLGFILASSLTTIYVYTIIFLVDVEKTNKYNSLPTTVFLAIATIISILLIVSNRKKIEIQKFKLVLIGIIFWFLGESTYMFYQFILDIPIPYPSIAEIFYIGGYVFLIGHIYNSLKVIKKNKIINSKFIIPAILISSAIPILSTVQMLSYGVDFYSQIIEFSINIIYYVLDVVLFVFSFIILINLPKNSHFIYHWLLFCSSMVLITIADFGYTYTSNIDEDLLWETEIIWNVIYAFAYLFLSGALIWYYKLTGNLSKGLDDSFRTSRNNNENNLISKSENGSGYKLDRKENCDFKTIEKSISKLIKNTVNEINLLICSPDSINREETRTILNIVKNEVKFNSTRIRILVPSKNDNKILSDFQNIKNFELRMFERNLENNDIIIISDFNQILGLSYKFISTDNKYIEYDMFYSDKEQVTYPYLTSFEKLWVLQTVMKCI